MGGARTLRTTRRSDPMPIPIPFCFIDGATLRRVRPCGAAGWEPVGDDEGECPYRGTMRCVSDSGEKICAGVRGWLHTSGSDFVLCGFDTDDV